MRKFLVVAVLAGLTWLFVVQKQGESQKAAATSKTAGQPAGSPSPTAHYWVKRSLDRANEVKRQVAQKRKEDGTR